MGYVDTHLEAGERVLFRTRLHPVVFGGTIVFTMFAIGAAALIVARNELASQTVVLLWMATGLTVILSWVPPIVRWRTSEFAATTQRLLVKVGLLRVRSMDVPGAGTRAIEVERTIWGRWLGYGTLHVIDDEGVAHVFPRVARADALPEALRRHAAPAGRARAR